MTRVLTCRAIRASIRPRLLSRGDDHRPDDCDDRRKASIRPRLLSRGDAARNGMHGEFVVASIRPRLLSRGDSYSWVGLGHCQCARASIRPRLLSRGDVPSTVTPPITSLTLQFGHGF